MRLLLVGPPGAGKGTQARRVAERHGSMHIASGDILREAVAAGTPLGKQIQEYVDRGDLVPDDIVIDLIARQLERLPAGGFVLDGFPRTRAQAEALDAVLERIGAALELVVRLVVADDDIVERLSGRRTCPSCQRAYHVVYSPPRVPGHCDEDGTELVTRADDEADTIRHRLRVYREQTEGMLEHFRDANLLVEIDGVGTVDEVAERLAKAVEAGP